MFRMDDLIETVRLGRIEVLEEQLQKGMNSGLHAETLVSEGLLEAIGVVGEKFRKKEVFLADVLMAARCVNAGLDILKPYLTHDSTEDKGVAVCGAVKGDLHDIGIKLVEIMLMRKGFKVINLGVNVGAETFVDAAIRHRACLICCSAMLTVTAVETKFIVEEAVRRGIRDEVKIIVGGMAMSQASCDFIGADAYAEDAAACADTAETFFS